MLAPRRHTRISSSSEEFLKYSVGRIGRKMGSREKALFCQAGHLTNGRYEVMRA
jgi:hypothetical protein